MGGERLNPSAALRLNTSGKAGEADDLVHATYYPITSYCCYQPEPTITVTV